jgi:hypothetical protein
VLIIYVCCKQRRDLPVPAALTRMRRRTACRVYISPLCSNGRELSAGCKNVFSHAFISYSITFMVALPTVRKYQAVGGAVGQGFLQRSFFTNAAFEESQEHTWLLLRERSVTSTTCATGMSVLLTAVCQKYGVTGKTTWEYTSAFHISRAAWIPPEVWRLKSKWFGHSVPIHLLYSVFHNLYAKFRVLSVSDSLQVWCCASYIACSRISPQIWRLTNVGIGGMRDI